LSFRKQVLKFLSKRSKVTQPAKTGRIRISMLMENTMVHINKLYFKKEKYLTLDIKIVHKRLIEFKIEDIPRV